MTDDKILELAKDLDFHYSQTDNVVAFAKLIREETIKECINIVETYRVSVGNSHAGELACEWTMENLREIRDEMKELQ